MTDIQQQAIDKLRKQQAKHPKGSAPFGVAEQLIDICRREPAAAEIISVDLDNPEMNIAHAEKEIKKLADKKHLESHSNGVFVAPDEAETVLRKFFGLPDSDSGAAVPAVPDTPTVSLRFEDFL